MLLGCATASWGADDKFGGMSLFFSLLQMAFALLVVVGLILLTYYGMNRLLKSMPVLRQSGQYIRVIEVRPMGPRKSLVLLEVGGEYLLVANNENSLSLVKKINMLEKIVPIDEPSGTPSFLSFLNRAKSGAAVEALQIKRPE